MSSESMDDMSCYWTPENLIDDNLYALWVTKVGGDESLWALSPPWTPADTVCHPLSPLYSNELATDIGLLV